MAAGFVLAGEFAGFNFARLDVGLIESVDADDGPGYRGGDLPTEEFLPDGVNVWNRDANHGMAGFFEYCDGGILRFVRLGSEAQVSEEAIVAIFIGFCK